MASYAPNNDPNAGRIASPAPEYAQQQYQNPSQPQLHNSGIETAPYQQPQGQYVEKGNENLGPQSPPIAAQPPQPVYQQQGQNGSHFDHFQQDKGMANNQPQHQQGFPNQYQGQYQTATPLASLQQSPAPVDCPICHVRQITRTEFVSGGTTHISAILLCCCLCLGCIPYLASWFKDCEHHCGNCGGILAIWHRSGHTEVLAHARN